MAVPIIVLRDLDSAAASAARLFASTFSGMRNDGIERSVKLARGSVHPVRFGLCFRKERLSMEAVDRLSHALKIPEDGLGFIRVYYPDSRFIYFAFEQGENGPSCKLYFEMPGFDSVRRGGDVSRLADNVILRALKWNPLTDCPSRITDYVWMPRVSPDGMFSRILRCFEDQGDRLAESVVTLLSSLTQAGTLSALYVEASEATTLRRSFDVNLYGTGALLADVRSHIASIARCLDVDQNHLDAVLIPVLPQRLGHISGGMDGQGQPFTTFYYR